jgi:hypothetical protein
VADLSTIGNISLFYDLMTKQQSFNSGKDRQLVYPVAVG